MATAVAGKLDYLSETLSLTQEEMGELLGTSRRAVSRWRAGESRPQRVAKRRLLELAYIGEQLSNVMRREDANLWLFSPNALLGGDSPADRIPKGDYRSVLALIEALADGVVT